MTAADRIPGDHRHDRLGQAPDLHVQVGDVKAAHAGLAGGVLGQIAAVAAHALVAARAEGLRALAREHDHADRRVLARALERARDLDHGARPEGVADLRARDRDLRDPLRRGRRLVADVRVAVVPTIARVNPRDRHGAEG